MFSQVESERIEKEYFCMCACASHCLFSNSIQLCCIAAQHNKHLKAFFMLSSSQRRFLPVTLRRQWGKSIDNKRGRFRLLGYRVIVQSHKQRRGRPNFNNWTHIKKWPDGRKKNDRSKLRNTTGREAVLVKTLHTCHSYWCSIYGPPQTDLSYII